MNRLIFFTAGKITPEMVKKFSVWPVESRILEEIIIRIVVLKMIPIM